MRSPIGFPEGYGRSFRAGRRAASALAVAALLLAAAAAAAGPPRFADATAGAGLDGIAYPADLRRAKIVATMGGGVAWGDLDGDGDLDLYVTQGIEHDRPGRAPSPCGLVFLNDGTGRFADGASRLGIRACGWGQGVLVDDFDGDGDLDLFLTFVGANQLWVNGGDGTFREEAGARSAAAPGYNTGAAWLDHDEDGDLDLYVARYVETTPEAEREAPTFQLAMPEDYPAPDNVLLRQEADGSFSDVTAAAGAADPGGRSLAVVAVDLDLDGRTDLYVANDRSRNTLLHNVGDGSFEDATDLAGLGVGLDGTFDSAMGLAAGDVDGNGWPDLLVTNYVQEPNTLFLNLGHLTFVDGTREAGIYEAAYPWVGWAAELADFDDDGRLDLVVTNGHLVPSWIARVGSWLRRDDALVRLYAEGGYRQPVLIFQGVDGGFLPVDAPFPPLAGRGGAAGDVDRDGRLDLFLMSLSSREPALLLANRSERSGRWLALDLHPPGARRSPTGTRVVVGAGGTVQHLQAVSGGSYLSGSFRPLHVGLGKAATADVTLRSPGGRWSRYRRLPADRVVGIVP